MLLKEHSRRQITRVVKAIGSRQAAFDALMACYYAKEPVLAQRAAWAMSDCVIRHPPLIKKHLKKLLLFITKPELHSAMKRNVVRFLQFIEIPENLEGMAVDSCFRLIREPKESIAVKAFSLALLQRLCEKYPDLQHELLPELDRLSIDASSGLKNRIGKVRVALEKKRA